MTLFATRWAWAAGLVIIVLTNVAALAGVAWNRSGEPRAVMTLTERELDIPRAWGMERENSGVSLRVNWRVRGEGDLHDARMSRWQATGWLNEPLLRELGFEFPREVDARVAETINRMAVREALLVLEYAGPAWQQDVERARALVHKEQVLSDHSPGDQAAAKRLAQAREWLQREQVSASRLYVVDAGPDADALRSRYPDRTSHVVVRGLVHISAQEHERRGWVVEGRVSGLLVERLHVALGHRGILDQLGAEQHADHAPRFAVRVAFGQRMEPWVLQILATQEPE